MTRYRYTVYERATDFPLIYDGTADECARKMDVTRATFYSYVCKQKTNPQFGKYEIYVDEESVLAGQDTPVICDRCETVFMGGKYTFVCPDCRRKALRDAAENRNLARLGNDAYLKQLAIRGTRKRGRK